MPDVLAIIKDPRKAALTGSIDGHLTDVKAEEPNADLINVSNKHYQLELYKHLSSIFGLGAATVPPERLALIWAALNGQLPMDQWRNFEKDILPNPVNISDPDHDRTDRILKFMTVFALLRQPLDAKGEQRSVLKLDELFLSRVKVLFMPKSPISEQAFRGANSLLTLDTFLTRDPKGLSKN